MLHGVLILMHGVLHGPSCYMQGFLQNERHILLRALPSGPSTLGLHYEES